MRAAQTQRPEVLIATLGTQPEVVTLALDLLLESGCGIDEVVVIHTTGTQARIAAALRRLAQEFPDRTRYTHADLACHYQTVELQLDGEPIDDPRNDAEANAVFTTIFREVQRLKRVGKRIHLSIAGGRKSMSVYGMAVAQLLFDAEDRLWHLLSQPHLEASDAMHRKRPDEAVLVRIPVLGYSSLPTLLVTNDPIQAVAREQERLAQEQQRERREFVERVLTSAERRVVEEMMRQIVVERQVPGYESICRRLYLSRRTVENHLRSVYKKLQDFAGIDTPVDQTLLATFVLPYFSEQFASR